MDRLRTILKLLVGDGEQVSMEHQLFNGMMLIGSVIFFFNIFVNYFLNLSVLSVIFTFVFTLIFAIFYYFSRVFGEFKLFPLLTMILLTFVLIPLFWFTNGGSAGGFQYYLIFMGVVLVALSKGGSRIFFLSSYSVVTVTLFLLEYLYPRWIIGYHLDRLARLVDISLGMSGAEITLVLIFSIYIKGYQKKQRQIDIVGQEIKKIVMRDGATGVFHQHYLLNRLKQEVFLAVRDQRPLSIAVISGVGLQKISLDVGDEVYQKIFSRIGEMIRESCRETDLIGYYGDGFLIVALESSATALGSCCDRIQQRIATTSFPRRVAIKLSINVIDRGEMGYEALIEEIESMVSGAGNEMA